MRLSLPVIVRSTRARVLGWFLFIIAVALCVTVVAVQASLQARARSSISAELQHEVLKFREYAAERPVDRTTGRPFASTEDLLKRYLADAVPEVDEAMFSVVDGRAAHRTRNAVPERLDQRPDVIATASAATEPMTRTVRTAEGDVLYAVVPVAAAGAPGAALVVVEYTAQTVAEVRSVVRLLVLSALIALVLAAAVSWFVAGRILAPLRQVRRTAEAISDSDLTRRIDVAADTRTDVARLARTFNGMLDRLESAFHAQRGFLDDAAHDLRTPLTVIRGHLELMGDDPADRAETTALLLEEIGRMNRMVDELVTLAAAERPDFLTLDQVDLCDLVLGVVARSSGLATRQWRVSDTAEASVLADRQRLTQALMQLVSNAVGVTHDGDPIEISSHVADGWAVLSVADHGPGVPTEDKAVVFDRFNRGTRSPEEGTGLGLAIVRSIAEAHRGRATVADTPGGGATFTIRFPARFTSTGDDGVDHVGSGTAGRDLGGPHPARRDLVRGGRQ